MPSDTLIAGLVLAATIAGLAALVATAPVSTPAEPIVEAVAMLDDTPDPAAPVVVGFDRLDAAGMDAAWPDPGGIELARCGAVVQRLAALESVRIPVELESDLCAAFVESGEDHGIDPALMAVIAWQESRFRAGVVSPDGCDCGLMGVRSATCIEGRPTCAELLDADRNVREAARLLDSRRDASGRPDLRRYAGCSTSRCASADARWELYEDVTR